MAKKKPNKNEKIEKFDVNNFSNRVKAGEKYTIQELNEWLTEIGKQSKEYLRRSQIALEESKARLEKMKEEFKELEKGEEWDQDCPKTKTNVGI